MYRAIWINKHIKVYFQVVSISLCFQLYFCLEKMFDIRTNIEIKSLPQTNPVFFNSMSLILDI